MRRAALVIAALLGCSPAAQPTMTEMIDAIRDDVQRTRNFTGVDRLDDRVLEAMRAVQRDEFVPERARREAYVNRPLPIGHGQTISQPYIVAIMTHLMDTDPADRVLEIGTGSGYQAAVLARIVDSVYTIEIIPQLAKSATERLDRLGYDNVHVRAGDGWYGWPEAAPFDAIIVTAVGEDVPGKLVEQLRPGGTMVLPIGTDWDQNLAVIEKGGDGEISMRHVLPVRFVPLTGDH